MGNYSSTQGFYKPDPDEFVDVESQWNDNVRTADERVRAMVEWQYTDVPMISGVLPRDKGYKWFKNATNSLFVCTDPVSGSIQQASDNGDTDPWSTELITSIDNGYQSHPTIPEAQLSYRLEPAEGSVTWRGLMVLNASMDQIPLNTNINVMTIATGIRPVRSKYFFVHMGVSTAGYSVVRIVFLDTGVVQINRMGVNQADPTERYISFNDICYPRNDA